MRKFTVSTLVALAVTFPLVAAAQKPSAYPAKGQTAEQQIIDDSQCLTWAQQTTGINPAAVAAAPVAPAGPQGERARGALRGAAAGAAIAQIGHGNAGRGAGVGATLGVVGGGARARRNEAAQAQQAQASKAQTTETYYRAYGACMQGRGYTVN